MQEGDLMSSQSALMILVVTLKIGSYPWIYEIGFDPGTSELSVCHAFDHTPNYRGPTLTRVSFDSVPKL